MSYFPMREGNFMGMVYYKPTLLMQIEGLLDGDKLTFMSYINGMSYVYVVDVSLTEDGSELWFFYQDNKTYPSKYNYDPATSNGKDNIEIIKYSNSKTAIPGVTYSETPGKAMTEYINVYIDAMQAH